MHFVTILRSVVMGTLLIVTLSTVVSAVQENPSESLVADELRALSTSIDRLAKQMENQASSSGQDTSLRKLDITIAYLNFRSRRIEMVERDLQSARTSRNRLDDILEQFQREEESLS